MGATCFSDGAKRDPDFVGATDPRSPDYDRTPFVAGGPAAKQQQASRQPAPPEDMRSPTVSVARTPMLSSGPQSMNLADARKQASRDAARSMPR